MRFLREFVRGDRKEGEMGEVEKLGGAKEKRREDWKKEILVEN
jgi:hypothetical protein